MLRDRCPGIPANTITNLVKIFGASDLINGIVPGDIYTVHLPSKSMKSTAGIIPVPDMERFNPKPPFGETTSYTWALVHGVRLAGSLLACGFNLKSRIKHPAMFSILFEISCRGKP